MDERWVIFAKQAVCIVSLDTRRQQQSVIEPSQQDIVRLSARFILLLFQISSSELLLQQLNIRRVVSKQFKEGLSIEVSHC